MVEQTSLILAAAWALLILMAPPVHALTLHSTALDKTVSNRSSEPDVHDLDREFTEILSLGDNNPRLKKCTTGHSDAGSGGGGGGGGGGLGRRELRFRTIVGRSLLGVAGGGHSNNGSDSGFDFGADLQKFATDDRTSVSSTRFRPPYHFLHLASVRLGLLGWWRKRKARANAATA